MISVSSFRELAITEAYKFTGKLKPHEKILHNAYVDFLQDYYKVNLKIEISFRKPNKKLYFGFIDLIGLSNGKYKIVVEHILYGILGKIGHEFTHCVQYKNGDLGFTEDELSVTWKGKPFITAKELGKITDFNEYKKLPWEAEAYKAQDKLADLFLKSSFFKDIQGTNATIDFLFDNEAIS